MKRAILIALGLLLFLSGCGIPRDESPNLIARDELPIGLRPGQAPTPAPVAPISGTTSANQVYMIGPGNALQPVERTITDDPAELLETLLLGTSPEERAEGVTTTFTRNSQMRLVQIDDLFRLATVDIAPGSLDSARSEQKLGFAQIVFTLTSLPEIETVQFVQSDPANPDAEAVSIAVQTDTGTTVPGRAVGRTNFALLDPDTGPVIGFEPDLPTAVPTPEETAQPQLDLAVWKINDSDELVPGGRPLERSAEGLLSTLFDGIVSNQDDSLRSAIPPDAFANAISTQVFEFITVGPNDVETSINLSIATIDLAPGSLPPANEGDERMLALAQMVFTLTELIEIDQVTFAIDGVNIPAETPSGLTAPFGNENPFGLSRDDYVQLLPAAQRPGPTPTAIAALEPDAEPTVEPSPTPTPG
jgi:hypothetical protein